MNFLSAHRSSSPLTPASESEARWVETLVKSPVANNRQHPGCCRRGAVRCILKLIRAKEAPFMRLLILCGILLASTLADVSASFATLGRPPARNLAGEIRAYPQALPLVGRFRNLASSAERPGSGSPRTAMFGVNSVAQAASRSAKTSCGACRNSTIGCADFVSSEFHLRNARITTPRRLAVFRAS